MNKKKPRIFYFLGFIAAVFALGGIIIAISKFISLIPVKNYEDRGVMDFAAVEWYTETEKSRRRGGAPSYTRYRYYVKYTAVGDDGIPYTYRENMPSIEKAKALSKAKDKIQRRVLSGKDNYITIPAEQTKDQWLYQSIITYLAVFSGSAAYLIFFAVFIRKWKST